MPVYDIRHWPQCQYDILALMIMQQTSCYIRARAIRHNIGTHPWACGPRAQCQYLTYSPCTHAITSTYNLSPSSLSLLHLPHHKEVLTAMISQWRKGNMQSTLHSLKKTVVDANRAASTKMVHKVYPVVTKLTSCVNKIVDTQLMAITVSSWVVI